MFHRLSRWMNIIFPIYLINKTYRGNSPMESNTYRCHHVYLGWVSTDILDVLEIRPTKIPRRGKGVLVGSMYVNINLRNQYISAFCYLKEKYHRKHKTTIFVWARKWLSLIQHVLLLSDQIISISFVKVFRSVLPLSEGLYQNLPLNVRKFFFKQNMQK